ncbi:uncharacterized protein RSE6_01581 [Rhynchosporium secalis]|uniref:Uncharacterized protein n=1 Tax=Rhynchosporium secalis TaxID=38038 RepID=A0A1E1LY52_RHYSE|nr:uncharacterized protein RSE6_01581 [Rhynchosporium secalis]
MLRANQNRPQYSGRGKTLGLEWFAQGYINSQRAAVATPSSKKAEDGLSEQKMIVDTLVARISSTTSKMVTKVCVTILLRIMDQDDWLHAPWNTSDERVLNLGTVLSKNITLVILWLHHSVGRSLCIAWVYTVTRDDSVEVAETKLSFRVSFQMKLALLLQVIFRGMFNVDPPMPEFKLDVEEWRSWNNGTAATYILQ